MYQTPWVRVIIFTKAILKHFAIPFLFKYSENIDLKLKEVVTILSKVKAMQRNLAFFKCLRSATHWSSYGKSRTEALVHGIVTKSHAIERFIDPLVYVTQKCACAFGISIVVVMQEKRGTRASYRIISAAPFQFRQKFKGPRTSLFQAFLFYYDWSSQWVKKTMENLKLNTWLM